MHVIFAELSLSCLKMYGRKKQELEDEERKQSQGKTEMSSTTSSLSAMMARMAKDTSTSDFTLICGQLRRQVHSCVLANRSPYFEAAVKRWTQREREILVFLQIGRPTLKLQ